MAWTGNFKTQIEDLAGTLSASDDAAIQQWIVDGCYDVFNKFTSKYGEEEIFKFAVSSGNQTSNTINVDEIRSILGVVRNGVVAVKGEWRLQARYNDSDSIYAATAGSPVWFLDNGITNKILTIFPAPDGSNPTRYYYLPEYSVTSWESSTSSIAHYPSEYYYNVMLYASLQVLQRRLLDISSSAVNLRVVPPDVPSFEDTSLPSFETAPVYDASALLDGFQTSVTGFINDEDVELAQVKLQQFQAEVQNELNNFNDANVEYQASINKAMKEADLDNRDDEKALQLYQAEVSEYQAEVQAEVQDFMFTQKNYEWVEGQYLKILGMYQQSFGMPQGGTDNR